MRKTIRIWLNKMQVKLHFRAAVIHGKSITKRGRVDHKMLFRSYNIKDRGYGIFQQGTFVYKNVLYYLLDTRVIWIFFKWKSLEVMDYTIIILVENQGQLTQKLYGNY